MTKTARCCAAVATTETTSKPFLTVTEHQQQRSVYRLNPHKLLPPHSAKTLRMVRQNIIPLDRTSKAIFVLNRTFTFRFHEIKLMVRV